MAGIAGGQDRFGTVTRRGAVGIALAMVGAVVIQPSVLLTAAAPAETPKKPKKQKKPFIRRKGFVDFSVPYTGASLGSGSSGTPPFGLTNELGFVFDPLNPFSIDTTSIGLGIDGTATVSATIYEVQSGTLERIDQLASSVTTAVGVHPFLLNDRFGQGGDPPYFWFDVPLAWSLEVGTRYELIFSAFAFVAGTFTHDPNNWIFGAPLVDHEFGIVNSPYDVLNLATVVDGSLRGSRATLVPPALISIV